MVSLYTGDSNLSRKITHVAKFLKPEGMMVLNSSGFPPSQAGFNPQLKTRVPKPIMGRDRPDHTFLTRTEVTEYLRKLEKWEKPSKEADIIAINHFAKEQLVFYEYIPEYEHPFNTRLRQYFDTSLTEHVLALLLRSDSLKGVIKEFEERCSVKFMDTVEPLLRDGTVIISRDIIKRCSYDF